MKFIHTALSVRSLHTSRTFYETVFGMKLKAEGAHPELNVKFIMLEDERGQVIELFEHTTPVPLKEDLMDFSKVGIKHIAFEVTDMAAVMQKAIQAGAKTIWEPKKGVTVKQYAFIADPDNIPIELVELKPY